MTARTKREACADERRDTTDDGADAEWAAVFWDIGGVILALENVQAAHADFIEEIVERYDVDVGVEEAITTWRTTVGDYFRERDGTEFRSARDGYHRGVESVVGEAVSRDEWAPRFDEIVRSSIEPVPGASETIERLADRDIHVGVISDIDDAEAQKYLEGFGVRSYFDSITTSEEVGRTKPDPAIFETALEKAGVSPQRSLMIGDRYEHDIEGAAAVGMCGVAFGADDGPAVSYRIETPEQILDIIDGRGERTVRS